VTVLALGTAASRATGYLRASVWSAALGLNLVGATFLVANTVPTVLYVLLVGGALNSTFVPAWVEASRLPPRESRERTDKLLTAILLALVVVTVAATLAAPWIVRLYAGTTWTSGDIALAAAFATWCLPQILGYGVYAALSQLLASRDRFTASAWSPVFNNVVTLAVGVLFLTVWAVDTRARTAGEAGVRPWQVAVLGGGATLGIAVQALALVPALRRTGFGYTPRFDLRGAGLRRTAGAAGWTVVFVAASQAGYLATTVVANTAATAPGAAGLPAYTNASLLWLLPHGIVAVSIATAGLPALARAAGAGRTDLLLSRLGADLELVGVTSVLAAGAFLATSPDLARVAFAGNSAADGRSIGWVLCVLAPALPFFSLQYLLLRGFYAHGDTRTPALLQIGIAGTIAVLAIAAGRTLGPDRVVLGLAAGYGLSYVGGFLVTAAVFRRRYGDPGWRKLGAGVGRWAVLAAGAAAAGAAAGRSVRTEGLLSAAEAGGLAALAFAVVTYAAARTAGWGVPWRISSSTDPASST
jgi:putative peptidoglycan lipid II flippase